MKKIASYICNNNLNHILVFIFLSIFILLKLSDLNIEFLAYDEITGYFYISLYYLENLSPDFILNDFYSPKLNGKVPGYAILSALIGQAHTSEYSNAFELAPTFRSLSLLSSILCLVSVYFGVLRERNSWAALASVILILSSPIYYAQSALMYPDIVSLGLLSISIYFLLNRKHYIFIILGSLALATRELLALTMFPFVFYASIFEFKKNRKYHAIFKLWFPFIFLALFYIFQKYFTGHLNQNHEINSLALKPIKTYIIDVFTYIYWFLFFQGRWAQTCVILICLVLFKFKKGIFPEVKMLRFLIFFTFAVVLPFSILFILNTRYILPLIPVYSIFSALTLSVSIKSNALKYLVLSILVLININNIHPYHCPDTPPYNPEKLAYPLRLNAPFDDSMAYSDIKKVERKAIDYIASELRGKNIHTYAELAIFTNYRHGKPTNSDLKFILFDYHIPDKQIPNSSLYKNKYDYILRGNFINRKILYNMDNLISFMGFTKIRTFSEKCMRIDVYKRNEP